jgi:hypothetical protein
LENVTDSFAAQVCVLNDETYRSCAIGTDGNRRVSVPELGYAAGYTDQPGVHGDAIYLKLHIQEIPALGAAALIGHSRIACAGGTPNGHSSLDSIFPAPENGSEKL